MTTFESAVPIIPAREMETSTAWYRDRLGFEIQHVEREYGVVSRDDVYLHFWGPSGIAPEQSMFMYRIGVRGIDDLYEACRSEQIVHPRAPLEEQPWGAREFAVVDVDGNLLTFFEFPERA